MNYLTTNYKEFIRQKLNEGITKTEIISETANSNNGSQDNWWKEMRIEFEKIMKESDEIYNSYWGKLH